MGVRVSVRATVRVSMSVRASALGRVRARRWGGEGKDGVPPFASP